MTSPFTVDLEAMKLMAGDFDQAADAAGEIQASMHGDSGSGVGGSAFNLDTPDAWGCQLATRAGADFVEAWHYGMGLLKDACKDDSERLHKTITAYEQAEQEILRQFEQMLRALMEDR